MLYILHTTHIPAGDAPCDPGGVAAAAGGELSSVQPRRQLRGARQPGPGATPGLSLLQVSIISSNIYNIYNIYAATGTSGPGRGPL